MKKIEALQLARALGQLGDTKLGPKKGLKFYRFYLGLKGIQEELQEYDKKCREDFGIKDEDNDAEALKKHNEALAEMLNEEADIKVDPFLTEEELFTAVESKLSFDGLAILMPLLVKEKEEE